MEKLEAENHSEILKLYIYIYLVLILDNNESVISRRSNIYLPLYFRRSESLPWCSVELHPYATLDKTVPHSGPEQGEDSSRVHFQEEGGREEGRGGSRRLYTRTIMYSTVQWLSFSVFIHHTFGSSPYFIILFPLVKYLLYNTLKSWDNKLKNRNLTIV